MFNVDHLSKCLINMFNSFDDPYMYAVFFFPLTITRSPHILATTQQQSNASCSPATLSLRKLASSAYHSSGVVPAVPSVLF